MPAPEGFKKRRNPITGEEEIVPRVGGWNLTRDDRLKLWELENSRTVKNRITEQSILPKEMRDYSNTSFAKQGGVQPPDKPGYNPLSLDVFSTGAYATGAWLKESQNKRLGIKKSVGIGDAYFPSETLISDIPTAESERWARATKYNPVYQVLPTWGKKIYTDIAWDPLTFFTFGSGNVPKVMGYAGKYIGLAKSGIAAKTALIAKRASTVINTEGVKTVYYSPEIRHLLLKTLRENPKMVMTEGLRPIFTNIELLSAKWAPWQYVGSGFSKGYGVFNDVYIGLKERTRRILTTKIPTASDKFNDALASIRGKQYYNDIDDIRKAGIKIVNSAAETELRIKSLKLQIEGLKREATNLYGKDARFILAEYIENPAIRASFPNLKSIYDRTEVLRQMMVREEASVGIKYAERTNYVMHVATNQYKRLMGIIGKGKIDGYTLQREIKGTINAANIISRAQHGLDIFNPDGFKAIEKRLVQGIANVEAKNTYYSIIQTFGKSATDARKFKNFVKSKVPGVYLPKDLKVLIDNDVDIKRALDISSKEGASWFGKQSLRLYDTYNNFWARMSTIPFPEFHARNIYGSIYKNVMEGVNLFPYFKSKVVKKLDDEVMIVDKFGVPHTKKEVRQILEQVDVYGQMGQTDRAVGNPYGESIFKYPMMVGSFIEQEVRTMMAMDMIQRGDDITTIKTAIDSNHFDYKKVRSAFEEDIGRRLVPFLTWQVENRRNELQRMMTQFNKYSVLDKLIGTKGGNFTAQSEVERSFQPDYLHGQAIIPVGNNTWVGTGLPFEDVTKAPGIIGGGAESIAGNIAYPIVKLPWEAQTGVNMFTGQNITNWPEHLLKDVSPFGRGLKTADVLMDEKKTPTQKFLKVGLGINIYNATDWVWSVRNSPDGVVRLAIRRLGGKYHGCGY